MARQTSQSITNSRSLLKLMFIVSWGIPPNHLILCHPLLLLPSIFPSISVFSSESALHIRWPKYWSFSFNISPSNEYSGLISFRMDWLDLLAVQGTQESSPTPQLKRSQILILYLPTLSSLSGLFQSTFCPPIVLVAGRKACMASHPHPHHPSSASFESSSHPLPQG